MTDGEQITKVQIGTLKLIHDQRHAFEIVEIDLAHLTALGLIDWTSSLIKITRAGRAEFRARGLIEPVKSSHQSKRAK